MKFKLFWALFLCVCMTSVQGSAQSCNCGNAITYEQLETKKNQQKVILTLQKSPSKACQAKGYEFAARKSIENSEVDSIDFYLKKQKRLLMELGCSREYYYSHYFSYSHYYFLKQDPANMVKATYSALKIAELTKGDDENFSLLANLCLGHKILKQPELVKKYARRMYEVAKNNPDKKEQLNQLDQTSKQYLVLYQDLGKAAYLDTFRIQSLQVLDLAKQFKDTAALISSYRKMEAYFYYKKQYERAIEYDLMALNLAKRCEDFREGISNIYADIADIYIQKQEFVKAKLYVDSSIQIALESKNSFLIVNAYEAGIETSEKTGDYQTAFLYLKKVKIYEDSLLSAEKHKTVYEFEQKYQKAQDVKKISDLAKNKQISDLRLRYSLTVIAVICLILFIIVFLFRQYRIKSRVKEIETEQRLNRARMDPHFFFNALSSIQTLALQEQSPKTVLLLSKFSKIMRQSLESTYQELVTLEEDLSFLTKYMELQQMRYPNKFSTNIEINEGIEVNDLLVPSMLLQPFIENAIEHGFKSIETGGLLDLNFTIKEDRLVIQIQDNGKNVSENLNIKSEHISRAMSIANDRLFLLNKQNQTKSKIEQTQDDKGYKVSITLPILYKK